MQWFQIKEQAAGKNRLILSWYLYKIFGKKILDFIAFFVAFFTFIFAKSVRSYSKKYFISIEPYTKIKPSLRNQFKHIHSYADSLVDKILVYTGNFDKQNVVFNDNNAQKQLFADIEKNRGVFFICNHIGNIEVLQSFLLDKIAQPDFGINVFLSKRQSQIFNEFINNIKIDFPIKIFQIEDIGLSTGIELKENLDKGDIVFIAGDRLAENNDKKNIPQTLFANNIKLPKGTFKLAQLMDVPTYFISAVKCGGKYQIYLEKQTTLSENTLVKAYIKYLERVILINPFQFFHFYDFFN